jgi:hypothetical protein
MSKYEYWEYCCECGKPEKLDKNYQNTHYKSCPHYMEKKN